MWRIPLFTVLGLVPLGVGTYFCFVFPNARERAAIRGREEAREDIRQGKLVLLYWVRRDGGDSPEIDSDVRERLQVKGELGGSGCDHDERWDRMIGYNEVMLAEIERRAALLPEAGK